MLGRRSASRGSATLGAALVAILLIGALTAACSSAASDSVGPSQTSITPTARPAGTVAPTAVAPVVTPPALEPGAMSIQGPLFRMSTMAPSSYVPCASSNGPLSLEAWFDYAGKHYQGGLPKVPMVFKWHSAHGSLLTAKPSGGSAGPGRELITEDWAVWFAGAAGLQLDTVFVTAYLRDDTKPDRIGAFIAGAQQDVKIGGFTLLLPASVGFGDLGQPLADTPAAHAYKPGTAYKVTWSKPTVDHFSLEVIPLLGSLGGQVSRSMGQDLYEMAVTIRPTSADHPYPDGARIYLGLIQWESDGKGNITGCFGTAEMYLDIKN